MTGALEHLPAQQRAAAAAVRRLVDGLLAHEVDPTLSAEVARVVDELADRVTAGVPRTKAEAFRSYGRDRVEHFVRSGRWPDPPADGGTIVFDALSFVAGPLSPVAADGDYRRQGDRAVGTLTFGARHEGPPTRVHGGMLAAAFDEIMGVVFRARGLPSAFTGSLTIRYEAGAPLHRPLTFTAWLAAVDGRKYTVEAEGVGPDGRFASAEGLFIEMRAEHLQHALGDDLAATDEARTS